MDSDLQRAELRRGFGFGLGAYAIWGLVPLYFRLLREVPPVETVAHRVLWSVLLLLAILAARRGLREWVGVLRRPRLLAALGASAVLIGVNWLVYIWAVVNDHLVQASLGYFLNPLINVALGVLVLKERLSRGQGIAVALAVVGVAVPLAAASGGLWVSLTLAVSFGLYGLIRKVVPVGSLVGLTVETLLLAPLCLAYLAWAGARGTLAFGTDGATDALLVASAAVTSIPLLMFAAAARRLPYAVLGLLQYLAPSMVFAQGVFLFGEAVEPATLVCFGCIWTGLAIYSLDGLRLARRRRLATP